MCADWIGNFTPHAGTHTTTLTTIHPQLGQPTIPLPKMGMKESSHLERGEGVMLVQCPLSA